MSNIDITIIIATFNSAKTLPRTLKSVEKQTYPKKKIEVIIADGGSTDNTIGVANKYGTSIVNNKYTDPVSGKFLGYLRAKGKYIVFLDSDEVFESKNSLRTKVSAIESNKKVKAVASSGFVNPNGYPTVNCYINEFGDPFSYFIYRLPKDPRFYIRTMKKRYSVFAETKDYVVFDLSNNNNLPLIELVGGASMFDANFTKKNFPQTLINKLLLPHMYYLIHSIYPYIAITNNDYLIHYSADSVGRFLKKIRWRVKNNIYFKKGIGDSGYSGRERYQSRVSAYKKYLFVPYSFSIVLPLIDSIHLAVTRKKLGYLIHLPLCIVTTCYILYYSLLKTVGVQVQLKSYGDSKVIVR